MSRISRCLLCEALLKDSTSLQLHLTDHHQVLSVEGLYLLTHAENTPPPPELATATILRCPLCEALLKAHFIKPHLEEHHHVLSDQHNALSAKCYTLLMRTKPHPYAMPTQKNSPLTPTTSPGLTGSVSDVVPVMELGQNSNQQIDRQQGERRLPDKESPLVTVASNNYNYSPENDVERSHISPSSQPPQMTHHHSPPLPEQSLLESSDSLPPDSQVDRRDGEEVSRSPRDISRDLARDISRDLVRELSREQAVENEKHSQLMSEQQQQESIPTQTIMPASAPPLQQHIIKEEVLDDGGGSSDDGEQNQGPSPMETNNDIAPNTFKGKSWLTEPNPHPSTQGYRVVPMYRSFIYNPPQAVQTVQTQQHPPPVQAPPPAAPPTPRIEEQQQFVESTPQTGITFYEGQSFANFQQFKVLWDRYLSDTQTMVQKRSSKTGHDATYFPYKHVLYVCFYYGKGNSASWRDMEDSKAATNRKCRFKLRLHFDTKVGRYRITKYNGSHSNHQLGKVQRQSYSSQRQSYAASQNATANHLLANPTHNVPKRGDELLKAHSILRTHPLSSLTPLQHQSLGQDILFWQSNSMRELAEANPRLLSLSTLYPVAKEDFVLHLFYAHKNEEKYLVAWTFINCAVQRSAEIALTIFARFNPITQKQAELVVMNHSIEWVASAINIFCKAIFHLSLDNVHEHLTKRLHSSCDWERVENGAEKHKLCLQLLERVVYAKNETDYAINLKELELAGPATFMEYFYNNWNNKKDFWVYYIQQRTAEALKSSHLDKQESKIENFLTINRKSLTSCISLLMLFGEAPERLNAHLSLLESSQEPIMATKQIPISLTPAQQPDIKPNIVHRSPPDGFPKSSTPVVVNNNFPPASPAYDPPNYPAEFFAKSVERPSPAVQHKDSNGDNEESGDKIKEESTKERLFSGDSYEDAPSTPTQEANASNADYSPEYGITEEKVQYGQWKNGDFNNTSPSQPQEESQETEQPQECSGSEEETSPARDFPTSRNDSNNYPSFNSGLFPPGAVSSQFLPRHTFIPPPGSFPPPYLHTGSRDFPPLARAMFPPPTVPREIFSQPPIVASPVERDSGSPFTQSQ